MRPRTSWVSIVIGLTAGCCTAESLNFVGSAELRNGRIIRLTPAYRLQVGAVWHPEKRDVIGGFDTSFQFQLTKQGGLGKGADGFAFVLQNSGPSAIGGRGSAGGFAIGDGRGNHDQNGVPRSLAVFFDTYQNGEDRDPSDNYIVICNNGDVGDMQWPPAHLGVADKLRVRFKDRRVHSARIIYRPPVIIVYVDDFTKPVLVTPVDLRLVTDEEGRAWTGFTASTGGGWENHDIMNWSFGSNVESDITHVSSTISFGLSGCLEDRNLCTPRESQVEERGASRFHVLLPAHVEWGASIPNPQKQPVHITNLQGSICWDLQASGANGCGTPTEGSAPGGLITRFEDGRTYFSIHDPEGNFSDNQGFIEFDVTIR